MSKIDDEFWTRGIEDERKPQSLLELKKEELKDLEDLDRDDFHDRFDFINLFIIIIMMIAAIIDLFIRYDNNQIATKKN